ncbi:MAG: PCRF domain-containing protein, partial [Acholeplasmataceae bacterium]|nr:PCRF domain-containing protein [Acholeplasmataceae bacterium]
MISIRLDQIESRYDEIQEELQNPEVSTNIQKVRELSKTARSLEKTVFKYREYKEINRQIAGLKDLLKENDPEIREMAET